MPAGAPGSPHNSKEQAHLPPTLHSTRAARRRPFAAGMRLTFSRIVWAAVVLTVAASMYHLWTVHWISAMHDVSRASIKFERSALASGTKQTSGVAPDHTLCCVKAQLPCMWRPPLAGQHSMLHYAWLACWSCAHAGTMQAGGSGSSASASSSSSGAGGSSSSSSSSSSNSSTAVALAGQSTIILGADNAAVKHDKTCYAYLNTE